MFPFDETKKNRNISFEMSLFVCCNMQTVDLTTIQPTDEKKKIYTANIYNNNNNINTI